MIVRGRIPVAVPEHRSPVVPERPAWSPRGILARLAWFRRQPVPDPAVETYLSAYEALMAQMLPEAPLTRLERLHADLYGGRIAPSTAYYTMVTTAATVLHRNLTAAAELLDAMHPPAEAQRAFRRLVALHEAADRATNDVLNAAARGYFEVLQDALLELTQGIAAQRRTVDADHRSLRRGEVPPIPALVRADDLAQDLPSNVIPMVRTGTRGT